MNGRIWLYAGKQLIAHQCNEIDVGFRDYMRDRLISGAYDKSLSNLFTTSALQTSQTGKDGIAYQEVLTGDWFTMPTSFVVPPNARSKRLFGLVIPEETTGFQNFTLGQGSVDGGVYTTKYASFSLSESVNINPNVPISLIWQIELIRGALDQSPSPSLSP